MTRFQRFESALRRHGFIVGPLSLNDEKAIDGLIEDVCRTNGESENPMKTGSENGGNA